jgi:phosphate-selective porin
VLKSIRLLSLTAFTTFAWSLPALAQNAPPPAGSDSDDLEVPSNPTVPGAAAPKPLPERTPESTPTPAKEQSKPAVSAEDSELRREIAELRERLLAVEHAKAAPTRDAAVAPSATPSATKEQASSVQLEKNATSRPVPIGLRIGGYLQTQFETDQLSVDQLQQGGAPLNQNRFTLRRGRLRLDRGWEYANATLELDANTTRGMNVGIRRAEASVLYRGNNGYELPPLVMLSVGVTDLPFGFELLESSSVRPFMERSQGSLALFPTEMDVGMKLSGAISFVRYAFAVSNGEPVDTLNRYPRDPNAAKDYSGRVGVETRPLDALSISGGTSFYQGTGLHAGTDASKPSFTWLDINEDRAIQPNELQAVPGASAQPSLNFKRWAYGLDLELTLRTNFGATRLVAEGFLASNLDRGYLVADPAVGQNDIREAGGYVALVQDVTRWGQVGFRASYYDPNSDFFDSLRGRQVPTSLSTTTLSPMVALHWQDRARLSVQYDFVRDSLAKDSSGVPTDAKNNHLTVRLQVEL